MVKGGGVGGLEMRWGDERDEREMRWDEMCERDLFKGSRCFPSILYVYTLLLCANSGNWWFSLWGGMGKHLK